MTTGPSPAWGRSEFAPEMLPSPMPASKGSGEDLVTVGTPPDLRGALGVIVTAELILLQALAVSPQLSGLLGLPEGILCRVWGWGVTMR